MGYEGSLIVNMWLLGVLPQFIYGYTGQSQWLGICLNLSLSLSARHCLKADRAAARQESSKPSPPWRRWQLVSWFGNAHFVLQARPFCQKGCRIPPRKRYDKQQTCFGASALQKSRMPQGGWSQGEWSLVLLKSQPLLFTPYHSEPLCREEHGRGQQNWPVDASLEVEMPATHNYTSENRRVGMTFPPEKFPFIRL